MAWKYKRGGTWWLGTRANGKLIQQSTGESDEKKAEQKLAALRTMEQAQRAGQLNRELFEALTGAHIEVVSLFKALDTWVSETANRNTKKMYSTLAEKFKAALPHDPPIGDVTHEQIRSLLADIRAKSRPSTANLYLGCTKAFFSRFKGSLRKNPTEGIQPFKEDATVVKREAFTPEQIRKVVAVANPFWRCAAALAFYSGLRLSNVAMLKVGQVDFTAGKVVVARTIKTGAPVCVKLPASVMAMLREAIPAEAGPGDYIWPDQAKHAESGNVTNLSDQFGNLLVKAGIRPKHIDMRKDGLRNVNPYSFHSLRHALITALAESGANQQVVKKLVGHATDRINDAYTHIGQATLDKAVALLPDVTEVEVVK